MACKRQVTIQEEQERSPVEAKASSPTCVSLFRDDHIILITMAIPGSMAMVSQLDIEPDSQPPGPKPLEFVGKREYMVVYKQC